MSSRRVLPILQGIAAVRNWVAENVPGTDSLLGYELFLKLGNDIATGQPLLLSAIAPTMPYPADAIASQLRRFEELGLLTMAGTAWQATERLLTLLSHYGIIFESKFVLRDELRARQLWSASRHETLASLGCALYDRMYDLGWMYLHQFGSVCFMQASLVQRLAELHGCRARVLSCHVEIEQHAVYGATRFTLGGQGEAKPGQIDGHAVCLIDDELVVDFGLGNLRKYYRSDFYWGMLVDYRRDGATFASLALPGGETMRWKDDWQCPEGEAELARYAPLAEELVARYLERYS